MMNSRASRWKRNLFGVSVGCLWLSLQARTSLAQTAGNKAAAEALFEQGKLLMQSGDYSQACQKLEASQKLDEGIGTLLYLADCYEKTGRTASAWAMFKEAASIAGAQGQESRQKLASHRAKTLEPALVKVVIEVAQGNVALLGFEVRNDGVAIPAAQFGFPVPVDPGEHRIEASAPGKRAYSDAIKVTKGEGHVKVPLLEDLPVANSTPSQPSASALPEVASSSSMAMQSTTNGAPERDTAGNSSQRLVSYVVGGAGVVGMGIGAYFGLTAMHDHNSSKSACTTSDANACYPQALGQYNDAVREARASTIAFVAGGALLATGLVLYLTAPESKSLAVHTSAAFSPNLAQLTVGGAW